MYYDRYACYLCDQLFCVNWDHAMGNVKMVDELELLDNSNSGFSIADIYDIDFDAWYRGPSRSTDWRITSEEVTKKINEHFMKAMEGPEIFEAEVVVNDVT